MCILPTMAVKALTYDLSECFFVASVYVKLQQTEHFVSLVVFSLVPKLGLDVLLGEKTGLWTKHFQTDQDSL